MQAMRATLAGAALALGVAAAIALTTPPSHAAETRLTADEIQTLLAGNSVAGKFRDAEFTQYFDRNSHTLMVFGGAPPQVGRWKVDPEEDLYCSWWPATDWRCYMVFKSGDTLYWQRLESDERTTSTWLEGDQVNE